MSTHTGSLFERMSVAVLADRRDGSKGPALLIAREAVRLIALLGGRADGVSADLRSCLQDAVAYCVLHVLDGDVSDAELEGLACLTGLQDQEPERPSLFR